MCFNVTPPLHACTRILWAGADGQILTGRTMDWWENLRTDLRILPRGLTRSGIAGSNPIQWTSKYGSLITTAYQTITADGMNEKGLVINILDNFASVSEAVKKLADEPFRIVSRPLPNKTILKIHLALSDAAGDSAILEYIEGKLTIYHNKKYTVLTNEPAYHRQLLLYALRQPLDHFLGPPGALHSANRFACAHYYLKTLPDSCDRARAMAGMYGVLKTVAIPPGVSGPINKKWSSTLWTTIADSKNLTYFYSDSLRLNTFRVDLKELVFLPGSPVKKLVLQDTPDAALTGEISRLFIDEPHNSPDQPSP